MISPNTFISKCWGNINFAHLELLSNDKQIGGMIVVQQWHKISSKVELIMKFAILKTFFITRVVMIVRASFMLEK
jgi:hypothetical protein